MNKKAALALACILVAGCSGGQSANTLVPSNSLNNPESTQTQLLPLATLTKTTDTTAAVYSDTFASDSVGGPASGWDVASGMWSVCELGSNHGYCQTSPQSGIAVPNIPGSTSWKDYTINANVSRGTAAGGVALLFRMTNLSHFYQFEIRSDSHNANSQSWHIARYDGQWHQLIAGRWSLPTQQSAAIRIVLEGSSITAYNGGALLGTATDGTYPTGGIGLRTFKSSRSTFADISVQSATSNSITVAPTSGSLVVGESGTFTIAQEPFTNGFVAKSSSTNVATVTVSGTTLVAHAVSSGSSTISITGNGSAATTSLPITVQPSSTPAPSGNLLWTIGDSYAIAQEGNGPDVPVRSGSGLSFAINRPSSTSRASEYRDMIKLEPGGNAYFLNIGGTYAFRFTIENNLKVDTGSGAQALIWQVAPNGSGGNTSCSAEPNIGFQLRTLGGVNYLALYEYCYGSGGDGSIVWKTPYVVGGRDSYEFDVKLSSGSDGFTNVYKNGSPVYSYHGATLGSGQMRNPRTDIGVYESQWLNNPTYSDLAHQGLTFDSFTVSQM